MDRMTERITNKDTGDVLAYRAKTRKSVEAIQKLGRLEDLEEQGRLPILPCKIGDIVWNSQKIFDEFPYLPYPIKVSGFSVFENGIYLEGLYGADNRECSILISEIGKNVFLSENEALQKMNETEE